MDQTKDIVASTVEVEREPREVSQIACKPEDGLVAPDQFDERYRTTRKEVWAYYACVCRSPSLEDQETKMRVQLLYRQ